MYHIPVLIPYTISTSTIESVLRHVRSVSPEYDACEQKHAGALRTS